MKLSLSFFASIFLLTSPYAAADLTSDVEKLKKKGELVVAVHNLDHPPFHMKSKEGELIGLDADIAKEVARLLKIKVRFDRSAKTYDETIDLVAAGKADLAISKLSHTPRRALKVIYTEPYHTLSKACLINRVQLAAAGEVSLKELVSSAEKVPAQTSLKSPMHPTRGIPAIGALQGSSYERYVNVTFPNTKIEALTSWNELLSKAIKGELTAVCSDNNDVKLMISQDPNVAIKLMPIQLKEPDYLYIGGSKELPSLQSWIDNMIKNNPDLNMSYEKLSEKYKKELQ